MAEHDPAYYLRSSRSGVPAITAQDKTNPLSPCSSNVIPLRRLFDPVDKLLSTDLPSLQILQSAQHAFQPFSSHFRRVHLDFSFRDKRVGDLRQELSEEPIRDINRESADHSRK